ncbi:MAG: DEAD/DEAH box helicase [Elusimicrobia bacterium]|nr:DEAD/DEAH box helicase [Elusimicrobiota bacterium]
MNYAAGTLVRTRGREWVVLPESNPELLVLRPLGGTMDEIAGVCTVLERVEPASFQPPSPEDLGDYFSCQLLRDATRFGFRSSAGPFRSFGRLAVQPRPYQLVPLLMALKLDPVRLLIADDVGIGKTVEACLIARELLDRGEISRICVLCPPQLAEQWQTELSSKFNIDATLVLSSTARSLERHLPAGQSLFENYPHVVVSMDFIKSDSRYNDFLRTCPEFVIVDEAHTCALPGENTRSAAHQRFRLLSKLAENKQRHIVLVTATPHSGNEAAFRSLIGLLNPEFSELPENLAGPENVPYRKSVAAHFVQRRRGDIKHYLDADTPFPERDKDKPDEEFYRLSEPYKALFAKVLDYVRQSVKDESGSALQHRVRWWSALSLLRAMASSPAAAAATLRQRSITAEAPDVATADELGRKIVLDTHDDLGDELLDIPSGADSDNPDSDNPNRRKLRAFEREARMLEGDADTKLLKLVDILKDTLKDGYRPIVFCRFIQTAEYLKDQLRDRLGKKILVDCVTSSLPPTDRLTRIEAIPADTQSQRVLVCTDCLSEGINLQEKFDAVIHYDLSWNPTRHEQREGRVDRYGQKSKKIRALTYYGLDNQIDGVVLKVLIQKHKTIRNSLGISVPVPVNTDAVIEAIFEGLLLRTNSSISGPLLPGFEEFLLPKKEELNKHWEAAADREKRSRTMFAQESIDFQEVARELKATEQAIGSISDLQRFFTSILERSQAVVTKGRIIEVDLAGVPLAVKEALEDAKKLRVSFEPITERNVIILHRTHPILEGLASWVMNSALDPMQEGFARRAGVIRTHAVTARTVMLLLRLRYHIVSTIHGSTSNLLAEDALVAAFTGEPTNPSWLPMETAEILTAARSDANVPQDVATHNLRLITDNIESLYPTLQQYAKKRGEELLEAHRRVRTASGAQGAFKIDANSPDILGLYIYLPVPKIG